MSSTTTTDSPFDVLLSFQGQSIRLSNAVTTKTTVRELYKLVQEEITTADCCNDDDTNNKRQIIFKILYKGRVLDKKDDTVMFATPPKKTPKLLIMASSTSSVQTMNSKRSDPTIRGFDEEKKSKNNQSNSVWGHVSQQQDKNYKFCRFQACDWQSFGERASEQNTPHSYVAHNLLRKLAHDPGIISIMKERQLLVGTLGEMDPIDDRLKQSKEKQGLCLLGYNTNAGTRIDLKLRPNSLENFLPYSQIVCTLIHELSHNWVSEHNLLFWSNYGQMRAEYLHVHAVLAADGVLVKGKTTAQIADLPQGGNSNIAEMVLSELRKEMAQHGLSPDNNSIAPAIIERCRELQAQEGSGGQALGGESAITTRKMDPRQMALAAAERRRAREEEESKKKDDDNSKS